MLDQIIYAFIVIFIIMDPFSSVPVFVLLTRNYSAEKKRQAAAIASLVALCVALGFLLVGPFVLSLIGVRLESFQIAGGLLMLLIAISFALGLDMGKRRHDSVETVIIGVPMLAGPGVILTSLLLSNSVGLVPVVVALVGACLASFFILDFSSLLQAALGKRVLEIFSRVMGILLAGFAVEYIRKGFGI
ncbi:MAG: MarC family protein [Candidatus Micrarchaeota archaeon]|nr:MarC family protein [Candidatus Micrarchaeota archaeon]